MKNVLVIGENSYIGKNFVNFAKDRFKIKMVSSRNGQWKNISFTGFDSVLHCAGIAHTSQNPNMEQLYYEINRDLAVNVAKKAKDEGVPQFIFLSSILVYGKAKGTIDIDTKPNPDSFYGKSKLLAEYELEKLKSDDFKVCIVRPPMVYGYGCKGNFPKLIKLASLTPLFPNINNKRSMIYIENLCEFFCRLIENTNLGLYLPQNVQYVNTTTLVKSITKIHNKKIFTTTVFNFFILKLLRKISFINKLFGDLFYTHFENESEYNIVDFEESIRRSILGNLRLSYAKTRITVVTSYYLPDSTSISNLYENLAHDFAELGAEVTVVCGIPTRLVNTEITKKYIENPIEHINEKLKIIRTGPKKSEGQNFVFRAFYHLYRSYCVYRVARKIETDVYLICSAPPFMGVAGGLLAKRANTIYDLQDIFPDTLISSGKANENSLLVSLLRKMEMYIYKYNTHIRVISKDVANTIMSRGVPKDKITLIYNWIDESNVKYIERENNPIFDILNLSKDEFYICYAGNIGLLQNLSTVIDAAEILDKSLTRLKFVIIGDGAWKSEMVRRIELKALENVMVFPMQDIKLVPFVYNLGDIGLTTIGQGVSKGSMPSKALSIMSASRPIICEIDEGSELENIIISNECGLCISPNDSKGLANAILMLFNDADRLKKMGQNGRKYVEHTVTRKIGTKKLYDCAMQIKSKGRDF